MFEEFIENLKVNLTFPLPGIVAQFEMAHAAREKLLPNSADMGTYRPSAVLIVVYPNEMREPVFLLIERVKYNGHHSGQIALPGGKSDLSDIDLEATAMREFFEETGSNATPEIIGKLTPIYIPVSKFIVHPFVAVLKSRPEFMISEREVKQLIEWPLKEFLSTLTIKQTIVEPMPGFRINTPYFDVNGKILWGATAMIMNELKVIINAKN